MRHCLPKLGDGVTTWEPIETAPKGRPVLLLVREGAAIHVVQATFEQRFGCEGWRPLALEWHGCGCCGGGDVNPIAWAELPEVPAIFSEVKP